MPFDKLEDITVDDLKAMIGVTPERKRREYKRDLPGSKESDRREFVSDASSFANSEGGDLFFGIAADSQTNMPTELVGIPAADAEAAIATLENRLRDSVRPRLPILESERVSLEADRCILVMRVGASHLAPHQNSLNLRFFARNTTGKYPLEASELVDIALRRQSLPERMLEFRRLRLNVLANTPEDMPVPVDAPQRLVIHFIPEETFRRLDRENDWPALKRDRQYVMPVEPADGLSYKHNLDGFVYMNGLYPAKRQWYAQVFHDAVIEVVNGFALTDETGRTNIYPKRLDLQLFAAFKFARWALSNLKVSGRVTIFVSATGIRDFTIPGTLWTAMPRMLDMTGHSSKVGRDPALFNPVTVDSMAVEKEEAMRPIIIQFWHACGYDTAICYDEDGVYVDYPRA